VESDVSTHHYAYDHTFIYGSSRIATTSAHATAGVRGITLAGGPKFAFRNESAITPFVHVLFGGFYQKETGTSTLTYTVTLPGEKTMVSTYTNRLPSKNRGLSGLAGGGLDIGNGLVGARFQADYSLLHGDWGSPDRGVRIMTGIVFRFWWDDFACAALRSGVFSLATEDSLNLADAKSVREFEISPY